MSQIQAGTTYNSTSNRFITIENLNGHVNNAILTSGSITEQNDLEGGFQLTDSVLAYDISSGELVKATIQDVFDAIPNDIAVKNLNGKADQDIYIKPILSGTTPQKTQVLSDLYVGGSIGLNGSIVNPVPSDPAAIGIIKLGYNNNTFIPEGSLGNNFEVWGSTTEFKQTVNPSTSVARDHNVNIQGNLTVTKNINVDGTFSVNGKTPNTVFIWYYTQSIDATVSTGGVQTPVDVYVGTENVGCRQILIKLPPVSIQINNSDNSGTMRLKMDLVARADGDVLEHVVARYAYEGSGKPYNSVYIFRYPHQEILSPSNLDLTNKKLTFRIWANVNSGGDSIKVQQNLTGGYMKITTLAKDIEDVITTPYLSVSQTNSSAGTYTGGAQIYIYTINAFGTTILPDGNIPLQAFMT